MGRVMRSKLRPFVFALSTFDIGKVKKTIFFVVVSSLRKQLSALLLFAVAFSYCSLAQADTLTTVRDGGFESGNVAAAWSGVVAPGTEIQAVFGLGHTGDYAAQFSGFLNDSRPTSLFEAIEIIPGANYVLSFAIDDLFGRAGDVFKATFGGFTVAVTGDQAANAYLVVIATIDSAFVTPQAFYDLSFQGIAGSDTVWLLDDVSLTATSATPLPAALPLFATGLGALGLLGWRRKRNASATA